MIASLHHVLDGAVDPCGRSLEDGIPRWSLPPSNALEATLGRLSGEPPGELRLGLREHADGEGTGGEQQVV